MLSDSYYVIGKSHVYCQDYAFASSLLGDKACIAVSDGCSSSPNTDIGARYLVLEGFEGIYHNLIQQHLQKSFSVQDLLWRIIERVDEKLETFLSPYSLDATLLMAFEQLNGIVQVLACGDGVILARKNGVMETWEIDFRGAPAYLSYLLSRDRYKRYIEEGWGNRIVTHKIDGETIDREETSLNFKENLVPVSFVWDRTFDIFEYDLVMLLTDGVLSFQSKDDLRSISLEEIIPYITDFQVKTEGFLVRSHRHFLNKTCKRLGWQHTDDFGSAALLRKE